MILIYINSLFGFGGVFPHILPLMETCALHKCSGDVGGAPRTRARDISLDSSLWPAGTSAVRSGRALLRLPGGQAVTPHINVHIPATSLAVALQESPEPFAHQGLNFINVFNYVSINNLSVISASGARQGGLQYSLLRRTLSSNPVSIAGLPCDLGNIT